MPRPSTPRPIWRIVLLVSVWFGSACGPLLPRSEPTAATAPTAQPAPPTPTAARTAAPTPTRPQDPATATPAAVATEAPTVEPFVMPGGRLLLAVGTLSGEKYPNTDVDLFYQYRWLDLATGAASAHPVLIGDYPVEDTLVTIAPDLAHLAFVRTTWSKIDVAGTTQDAPTSHSVYLAGLEGGDMVPAGQPITQGSVNHVMGCGDSPAWSGDSRFLAYALNPAWTRRDPEHTLYVYDVATGRLNPVLIRSQQNLAAFSLSPDGAQIAVSEIEGTSEVGLNIHLMDADGGNDRLLFRGWVSSNLLWHPDGSRIYFKTDRIDGRTESGLYSIDVATGVTTLITPVTEHAACLGLAPDASRLTYVDSTWMMVDPEGGVPSSLMGGCDRRTLSAPVWSPDSRHFAIVADLEPKLYLVDLEGHCQFVDYREDALLPLQPIGWLP